MIFIEFTTLCGRRRSAVAEQARGPGRPRGAGLRHVVRDAMRCDAMRCAPGALCRPGGAATSPGRAREACAESGARRGDTEHGLLQNEVSPPPPGEQLPVSVAKDELQALT